MWIAAARDDGTSKWRDDFRRECRAFFELPPMTPLVCQTFRLQEASSSVIDRRGTNLLPTMAFILMPSQAPLCWQTAKDMSSYNVVSLLEVNSIEKL